MKRIVLTTSSCGFEHLGTAQRQIGRIPLHVHFGTSSFLDDGEQLTPKMLSEMIVKNDKAVAKTLPATEAEVSEIFADLYRRGYDEVFVCCLSSRFSQSYEILQKQQSAYAGKMNVCIYDTKALNLMEAALAYEANHMVQGEAPFGDIIPRLDKIRSQSLFNFSLHDLSYIIRNKKLSAPAGFVANLFDIKPIMEITPEGLIVPKAKVRKFERALRQMIADMDIATKGMPRYIYMSDGGIDELSESCSRIIMEELKLSSLPVIPVSSVSLANHGPKGIALGAFYGDLPRIIQELPEYKEI